MAKKRGPSPAPRKARKAAARTKAKAPAGDETLAPGAGHDGRYIVIRGARQHNLKNIDVRIERDRLVVLTGLSGSGKSSLAFDTVYAEGQRKYVESLSAYARQFLEQLAKPDVEHIEGLPPTVAIEQRSGGSNPRSIVATTTEIYDYMRLLFARAGVPHCWVCGRRITSQTVSQMVDALFTLLEGTRFMVLAPVVRGQKGQHLELLRHVQREGYVRVRVDGEIHELKDLPELDKNRAHSIDVVVDRLILRDTVTIRLSDSIETALTLANGLVVICYEEKPQDGEEAGAKASAPHSGGASAGGKWKDWLFSATYACPRHPEVSIEDLAPRMFSFNSPYGACESCDGLGTILEFDPELIVPDPTLSLSEGAVDAWRHGGKRMNIFYNRQLRRFCREHGVSPNVPYETLDAELRERLMYGDPDEGWEGVIPNLTRRWEKTDSEYVKARLHGYMSEQACGGCGGARLRPASLAVRIGERNIRDVTRMSIDEAVALYGG